jgi:CBS domain containing-hemolysin-like protein
MIELLMLGVSILLVLACGIFVAAEFAFVTVDRARINRLVAKGDVRAKGVQTALHSLSTQLSGAQIGITLTNLLIGFLAQPVIAESLYDPLALVGIEGSVATSVSVLLALMLATFLTMLFGELVPKNLAIAKPIGTSKAVQAPQRYFTKFMSWPIKVTNGTANTIVRKLGFEPQEELASARSMEELLAVVKHSAKRGTLEKDTAVLLERSLEFGERHASDVMTPRVKLEVVSATDPIQVVIDAVGKSGFSRFPVIGESIDDIVGIIHVRDAVAVPHAKRIQVQVKTCMNPVVFAPSSIELDALIEKMRDGAIDAVITVDEYGGVDGLVTLEDLIEELVGEVKDEHDESGVAVRRIKKNVWSVSGLLRPDEVGQELDIVLPEDEEYETVGGLMLDLLEAVPKTGDRVTVEALNRAGQKIMVLLTVSNMDGRRVDRITLSLQKVQESHDE